MSSRGPTGSASARHAAFLPRGRIVLATGGCRCPRPGAMGRASNSHGGSATPSCRRPRRWTRYCSTPAAPPARRSAVSRLRNDWDLKVAGGLPRTFRDRCCGRTSGQRSRRTRIVAPLAARRPAGGASGSRGQPSAGPDLRHARLAVASPDPPTTPNLSPDRPGDDAPGIARGARPRPPRPRRLGHPRGPDPGGPAARSCTRSSAGRFRSPVRRGYSYAEATAGGVDLSEIDPSTMESRRCPGVVLVGEMLDVDGRLGGFNFQWAWSSARAAAGALRRSIGIRERPLPTPLIPAGVQSGGACRPHPLPVPGARCLRRRDTSRRPGAPAGRR